MTPKKEHPRVAAGRSVIGDIVDVLEAWGFAAPTAAANRWPVRDHIRGAKARRQWSASGRTVAR